MTGRASIPLDQAVSRGDVDDRLIVLPQSPGERGCRQADHGDAVGQRRQPACSAVVQGVRLVDQDESQITQVMVDIAAPPESAPERLSGHKLHQGIGPATPMGCLHDAMAGTYKSMAVDV